MLFLQGDDVNFFNSNIYSTISGCITKCLPPRKWMSENPVFTPAYISSTVSVTVLVMGVPSSEKTWSKYLSWTRVIYGELQRLFSSSWLDFDLFCRNISDKRLKILSCAPYVFGKFIKEIWNIRSQLSKWLLSTLYYIIVWPKKVTVSVK